MARKIIWLLAVLLVSTMGLPISAAADVTFAFTQTNQPGDFATATITLDDAAFRDGISVDRGAPYGPFPSDLLGTGIIDINISAGRISAGPFVPTPFDPQFFPFPEWSVGLDSGPAGVPEGEVTYYNAYENRGFLFELGDPLSSTLIAGADDDALLNCPRGQCIFTGTWALVGPAPVPEPASLGLLVPGVIGLVMRRQRRAVWRGA